MRCLKWDASPSKLGHWAVVVVVADAPSKMQTLHRLSWALGSGCSGGRCAV